MPVSTGTAPAPGASGDFPPVFYAVIRWIDRFSDVTGRLFNDSRNRFRNSSGKIAGWAIAFSTNIHGGSGWAWTRPRAA